MAVNRPTYDEILRRINSRIRSETPLTGQLEGTVIGMIQKIIATELDRLWEELEELDRQSNISTATGQYLDSLGALIGVRRKTPTRASSVGLTRSVRFYNNSNVQVNIPSGTRIWSDSRPTVVYFTVEGLIIEPGSYADVHVRAADTGEMFNVGIGELNRHNYPSGSVTVTNILPIETGSGYESDNSLRDRIVQEFQRRDTLTMSNLVALLREVPGVRDIYPVEFRRGTGTIDVIVMPYNIGSTSQVVADCQAILDQNVPVGISARALAPTLRFLDVRVKLIFSNTNTARRDEIRSSVKNQIRARIDNLPVEDGTGVGSFSLPQIRSLAIMADPSVQDAVVSVGLDGRPLSTEGVIDLGVGQRLALRGLTVD